MKVAIPDWQGRVSPVFDVAGHMVLVELDSGGLQIARGSIALTASGYRERAAQVAGTGAGVLICGAISRPLEMAVAALGIRVIPQTCGDVNEVLAAFVGGRLNDTMFLMPGCCGHRRRGYRRGFGRGRWSGRSV